jgi:hypothetical protein
MSLAVPLRTPDAANSVVLGDRIGRALADRPAADIVQSPFLEMPLRIDLCAFPLDIVTDGP